MTRFIQIVLGLFGLLLVLVLAAVILIPMFVDPNDYRDEIARAVEERTGRSLEIQGEISLSVFPWLGLEVGAVRLGNPPGFGDEPFVEIRSAGVGARLLPLLSRRLEVSTLRLDGLRVDLVRRADGSTNWDGLGGDEDAAATPTPAEDRGQFTLEQVGGLRLTDALIRYRDLGEGTVVEAAIPTLSTGELAPGQAFTLELEAAITSAPDAEAIRVRLAASVLVAEGPLFEIEALGLGFELGGPGVPGGSQAGRIDAPRVTADLGAQTLAVPAWTFEAAGLRGSGELAGTQIVDAPAFVGRVSLEEFSPRGLLERLGERGPDTADRAVLGKASLEASFRAGADEAQFEDLRVMLDDTTLTGKAGIGFGEPLRIRAELQLDAIDLDRYLPPEAEASADAPPAEDAPLAFDWLRGLDLDASFQAGTLKVNGLTLSDLEGRAVARDGVLTLQPFDAALYGGQVRGSARLDARQAPATLSLEQSLSSLQLLPFVQDLADFDRLTGVAQLNAKLATTASSVAGLTSGLNGELSFDLSEGALQGVNLWFEIQRAYALARGREAPQKTSPDTPFRQLKGTAVIRDGMLVNQDLVGGLPFLALAGRGEIDLAAAELDYRLNATVIREAVDEATGAASELAGMSVPLRLRGSLDSPSVSVDVSGLLRDRAEREALRRLGLEAEEGTDAEEQLKEKALDKVRGLFDRKTRGD
ncbi:MAG: AsmA family protein [Gammaproteobacteria bacterium]